MRLKPGSRSKKTPADSMTMMEHLIELRSRLIKSAAIVVLSVIVVWVFYGPIFDFITVPYCDLRSDLGEDCYFLAKEPLTGFNTQLTLAGYGGMTLALPFILYQFARFILPGLYPKERRVLYPFLIGVVVFLLAGMSVAYWFMPRALNVLVLGFGGDNFQPFFEPNLYLTFFVKMVLAFGLAFQTPVILVFLQYVGLVETKTLRSNRRIALVVAVIAGAIITPTGDPVNLAIMVVPMYLFYEISMIIGSVLTRRRSRSAAKN